MPAEAAIFSPEQSDVGFEFASEFESTVNDNESPAFLSVNDHETSGSERLDPVTRLFVEYKGGRADDWNVESSSGGFHFENGRVRNTETGETWNGFALETLRELGEGETSHVRLEDHIEEIPEGEKHTVTYLFRDKDNNVSYEMRSIIIRDAVDAPSMRPLSNDRERYRDTGYIEAEPTVEVIRRSLTEKREVAVAEQAAHDVIAEESASIESIHIETLPDLPALAIDELSDVVPLKGARSTAGSPEIASALLHDFLSRETLEAHPNVAQDSAPATPPAESQKSTAPAFPPASEDVVLPFRMRRDRELNGIRLVNAT